jgi:hypothetical protein
MSKITPQRKRTLKIVVILSLTWFAIVLPVPFLWVYPSIQHSEEYQTYVIIAALLSIPLAARGIIWIKRPQDSVRS